MDASSLTTVITTITGIAGGLYGGARYGKQSALADAANSSTVSVNTMEMFQAQVDHLNEVNNEQAATVVELTARVCLLEDLVTQRAAVAEVHDDVKSMRTVVDSIAVKVGV